MAKRDIEQRVSDLETRVAELQKCVANGERPKDWRRTIGMFGDDPLMKEIFDEALRFRERDRDKARHRYARTDKKQKLSTKKA
jgi:hypothetical protein